MWVIITDNDVINSQCLTFGTKVKLACAKASFFAVPLSSYLFENPTPDSQKT